jgi:hypothetical protein
MTLQHPHLYEISAWPWLERLSAAAESRVTLADVPPADWDRIAGAGFDYVFLMGVWRRSSVGREIARSHQELVAEYNRVLPGWTPDDVAGSPYCIQAYEPDDRMGGWRGLDAARRALGDRGVKLILDFVPNHTAFDHAWIVDHPDFYVTGTEEDYRRAPLEFRRVDTRAGARVIACGRDPYFAPWTDVAQLNYFNPQTRAAMQSTLATIADHCDGVRCDMAMLVLNEVFDGTWRRLLDGRWTRPRSEFWVDATWSVPKLVYLAEVYWSLEERLLDQGFTFAYDKRLLDAIHGPDAASTVRDVLASPLPEPFRLARFIENHDEPRSAATLSRCVTAAASLVATGPGMRFFYDGQLQGRRIKAPVQLARWPDEPADEPIRAMYERILRFAREPLLHEGDWALLPVLSAGDHSFNDIVAYRWRQPIKGRPTSVGRGVMPQSPSLHDQLAVVVLNFGRSAAQAHVRVIDDLPPGYAFDFVDALTDARYRWTRESLVDSGLYVRLEAGGAHLFRVERAVG